MRAQPKKTKKKGGREISPACPSSGECYKAIIMPENEKWNKVVGARKGEAETETKSWKFRAQRRKKRSFITYAERQSCRIDAQLKHGWTTVFALVCQVCSVWKWRGEEVEMCRICAELQTWITGCFSQPAQTEAWAARRYLMLQNPKCESQNSTQGSFTHI